jgi:hypothetical protein
MFVELLPVVAIIGLAGLLVSPVRRVDDGQRGDGDA